jgi:hypothetical protein
MQHPKVGEIVIVKEDQKPRNTWKLAIVKQLITGRDGVIRAAKLKTAGGNNYLERAIQHLFPLELECDKEITTNHFNHFNLPVEDCRLAVESSSK